MHILDSCPIVYLENLYLMNSFQRVNPKDPLHLVCFRVLVLDMKVLMLPSLEPVLADKNDQSRWGK